MSLRLALVNRLLPLRPRSTSSAASLHEAIRNRKDSAKVTKRLLRTATVQESTVQGQRVITILPKAPRGGAHLIFTHGGCYTFPLLELHWNLLAALVERSGISVTVPLYGLAPEYTVTDAYALLDAVHADVSSRHDRVFLAGDSAGGGLALGQAQRYRDAGLPPAAGVLLISPWLDATMSNPGVAPVAPHDRMLAPAGLIEAGRLWAGDLDPRDTRVSPLFGDLAGLPPVFTYQGDRDVLLADTRDLTRRILATGGRAELRILRGGFHDYPALQWLPESRRAIRRMADVLSG